MLRVHTYPASPIASVDIGQLGLTGTRIKNFLFERGQYTLAIAATSIGLSIGLTSVEPDLVSKSILIVNMILGKFEVIVLLYIFFDAIRRRVS